MTAVVLQLARETARMTATRGVATLPNEHPQRPTVTGRIYDTIFELLEQHPDGIRWSELNARVEASDPSLHPKTINGCVWRLVEKYPERVYKPSKGVFRLTKHRSVEEGDADSRGHDSASP